MRLLLVCAVSMFLLAGCRRTPPEVVLWVWERPEDLRSLAPGAQLAVLLQSVELSGNQVRTRARLQPVHAPDGASVTGVIRLDAAPGFTQSDEQRHAVVSAASELPKRYGVKTVQIDFDARASERGFYRNILIDIRRALPSDVSLSMTALASWCVSDPWIRDLPVDEAVPMLFEMGADRDAVLTNLRNGGDFSVELCRKSLGLSLNEPAWSYPRGRKLYLFSPRGWTSDTLSAAANLRAIL